MNNIVPGYYVYRSPGKKRKYFWVIDEKYTIAVHTDLSRINLIKTSSFKSSFGHGGWGKQYFVTWIGLDYVFLKKTTKRLFDFHWDNVYKNLRNKR